MFSLLVILVVLGGNLRRGSSFMEVMWRMLVLGSSGDRGSAFVELDKVPWLIVFGLRVFLMGVVMLAAGSVVRLPRVGEFRVFFECTTQSPSRKNRRSSSE